MTMPDVGTVTPTLVVVGLVVVGVVAGLTVGFVA
jgi:hypothetical protein